MSTLSSLRTLTRQQYRFDPNGRVFGDTELDGYIQHAYKIVQSQMGLTLESKEALAITAGTSEYALPTNLERILDDGVLINTIPLEQSDYTATSGLTQQAKPTRYYLRELEAGLYIGFIDIPDASYTVNVFFKGFRDELSASEWASTPTRFDILIALYAAYYAEYTLRGNTQNAVAKLQAYEQEKKVLSRSRFRTMTTFKTKR